MISPEFWTIVGTAVALAAFLYSILRNFKTDVVDRLDKLQMQLNILDSRVSRIEGHLYGMHWQPKIIEKEEK